MRNMINANSGYGVNPERRNIMLGENRICTRCKKQINPIQSGIKEIKVSEVSMTIRSAICKAYLCDDCWKKLNKWLVTKEE